MQIIILVIADYHAKNNVKRLGFSQRFYTHSHLCWCERSVFLGISNRCHPFLQSWERPDPLPQLPPCSIGRDVWAIELCQFGSSIVFDELCFHDAKVMLFLHITHDCNR